MQQVIYETSSGLQLNNIQNNMSSQYSYQDNYLPNYNTNIAPYYWGSYPVYITTDKTAKAIQILEILQIEKVIEVKSVTRFIELVKKITATL